MRILFVSNIYPPAYLGGYELACREVADALSERGHEVRVLTSTYKADTVEPEAGVYRELEHSFGRYPEGEKPQDFLTVVKGDWFSPRNFMLALERIRRVRPDVVYFWCLGQVSISVAFAAQLLRVPCAFYVFDRWLLHVLERYTQSARVLGRPVKRCVLAPVLGRLEFTHAAFGSRYLQDCYTAEAIIAPRDPRVLYHGLRLDDWPPSEVGVKLHDPCRLLYVGQVGHHKGVHTILEALQQIEGEHRFELDIVGTGPPDYQRRLAEQAALLKRTSVRFLGKKPRADLARIYGEHDLLLFPSIIEEGLGLVIVEAMACGTPAIVSRTGGSPETVEGAPVPNTFERGNSHELRECLARIVSSAATWRELRDWGVERVRSAFSFERTVVKTEEFLAEVARSGSRSLPTGGLAIPRARSKRSFLRPMFLALIASAVAPDVGSVPGKCAEHKGAVVSLLSDACSQHP